MGPHSGSRPRWLIFGIGNPSRGDDALGSLFIERLELWRDFAGPLGVDLVTLTDFQCQIEHALDLKDVDLVIFVDASVSALPPFELTLLPASIDTSFTTHALSPGCVLGVAKSLGQTLPESWTLAIPGVAFELGTPLSRESAANLETALDAICDCLLAGELTPLTHPLLARRKKVVGAT